MKDGFVATRNHGRIHYLEKGAGKPIILLHTNGNSAWEYEAVIEVLAKTRRVIAWDQPGHGDSDPITRYYSVEDFSDAVIEFMDALGLQTSHVFGDSIGGGIAVDLGARHGKRIEKLFICECPLRSEEEWAKRWLSTEENYGFPVQTAEQLKGRLREVKPDVLKRWNIDRSKAGPWAMIQVMWALRLYDFHAAIPKVTPRTMLVFGKDSQVNVGAPTFQKGIAGAQLTMMDNCGHFPMLDDPEGLARIIDDFIDA